MFKFDEYPEIKAAHEDYLLKQKQMKKAGDAYEASGYLEDLKAKYEKSYTNLCDYKFYIFSKVIFETFNPIKPVLRNVWKCNKESTWDEIIGEEFKDGDEDQGSILIGLVEEEDPYILPAEYYTGKTQIEIYFEQKERE